MIVGANARVLLDAASIDASMRIILMVGKGSFDGKGFLEDLKPSRSVIQNKRELDRD